MLFANIGPKRAFQINIRTKMAAKSTQNGTNLAHGGGKGYQQINKIMKIKNTPTQSIKVIICVFNVRRFPQKSEGSAAGRLLMFYETK